MRGFLKRNKELLRSAHVLGQVYGRRPSEFLTGDDALWHLDMACYNAGVKAGRK